MPSLRSLRSTYGAHLRHHGIDAPTTVEARRNLAAAHIAALIERTQRDEPPLTAEQRHALASALLSGGEAK